MNREHDSDHPATIKDVFRPARYSAWCFRGVRPMSFYKRSRMGVGRCGS